MPEAVAYVRDQVRHHQDGSVLEIYERTSEIDTRVSILLEGTEPS